MREGQGQEDSLMKKPVPERDPYTQLEAYDCSQQPDSVATDSSNENAIRCVAGVLDFCAQIGNEEVDGFVAFGLSRVLSKIADAVAFDRRKFARELEEHETDAIRDTEKLLLSGRAA
jgi:hypothetical protein